MRYILGMLVIAWLTSSPNYWQMIDDGMYVMEYKSPQLSEYDNSTITVLRVDPDKYEFNLFTNSGRKTALEWSRQNHLSVVVNAGMYDGYSKNMGYMKHYNNVSNPKFNKNNAILAFNSVSDTLPSIQIIDLKKQDMSRLNDKYNSFTQSIRMVDLDGNNKWSVQDKMWSIVVVAIDTNGHALFIHCRSPYRVHDFINIIMSAPLNIKNVMYLEGGPEASLYVNHNGTEIERVGSYETNFLEDNSNREFWAIPNIIGITKK